MSGTTEVARITVNGDRREVGVPSHYTLLETLRYALGLTGSKQGCDKGDCGACTVILEGEPTLSCITPVWEAEDKEVITVEGLASREGPHPLQDAFDLNGAAQCGFCTPGILCSAAALLERDPSPDREEIKEALAGNLCRCTGYTKIYDAVEEAGARVRSGEPGIPHRSRRRGASRADPEPTSPSSSTPSPEPASPPSPRPEPASAPSPPPRREPSGREGDG